ncbi:putative tetratricopeptide-like helical domain superfamily [Helianthus debilis subsp. tardiflorus]
MEGRSQTLDTFFPALTNHRKEGICIIWLSVSHRMKALLRVLFSKPPPAKKPSQFIDEPQFISLIHSSKSINHLHAQIILHHLISSYSFNNNFTNHALSIFHHFKNPNLYIFNSLIRALAHNSYYMTSISYFVLMSRSNIRPANLTFSFVLKSTAALQEGWLGMEIHTQILTLGLL